jgi:hypothetical protein
MKARILQGEVNTGLLKPVKSGTEFEYVKLKKGRYIYKNHAHPLRSQEEFYYRRVFCLEHKNEKIYWLDTFGKRSGNHGIHIGLSWTQHQLFLWKQNTHWLQKEDNIRYLINILFLIIGVIIAFKQK